MKSLNPSTMAAPVAAYSHGVLVPANTELLYVAGQVGLRPDGSLPDSIEEQAREAFANVVRVLESAGMTPANLVKINSYLVSGQPEAAVRAARQAAFGDVRPASTLIYVPALVAPEYLFEIDAVAARA